MALFGNLFGRRKPARPVSTRGHRGIAAGSLKPGEQDLSAANVARWKTLSASDVDAFLYDGDLLFVHSTWLAAAQYHGSENALMVEFLDGARVLVRDVDLNLAREFATAQSKGGWYWDRVLVRGEGMRGKTQRPVEPL